MENKLLGVGEGGERGHENGQNNCLINGRSLTQKQSD